MAEPRGDGTVLVVGATGVVGGMVVRDLLDRGEKVRALVREGSDSSALAAAGAEIVAGDLKRALTLRHAVEGVERVISTATASGRHGGGDSIETVDRVGTAALIDAAREAGVERFVYVSAYGFEKDSPVALARAKAENEARLEGNGLPYTILRPALFMDVWIGWVIGSQLQADSKVRLAGTGNEKFGFVAARNVADLAAATLRDPRAEDAKIPLCADVASFREVVKRIEKASGRSIAVETVEPGGEIPGLPPLVAELMEGLGQGEPPPVTDEVHETYGIRPVTVEEFVQERFASPERT